MSIIKNNKFKYWTKSSSLMNAVLSNLKHHAVFILNSKGKIEGVNSTAEALTGYELDEIIGDNYSLLFSEQNHFSRAFEKELFNASKAGNSKVDCICIRKNGTGFWANCTISYVNSSPQVEFFILVIQDITERKEIEKKKDEYIAIASHELKNPIAALSLYSELLNDHLVEQKDVKTIEVLKDMQGQISRLVNLVNDLLLVSEVERKSISLNKKYFDLNKLIMKIIANFQSSTTTHNIVYRKKIKKLVFGDENRIAQILVNLIGNGIKYSSSETSIYVDIEIKNKKAIISVQDSGRGISSKEKTQIFQPYYRSYGLEKGNIPGLGLGLYISKEIIKSHKEKIWVKSKKGKGSTFYFSLPIE